jgi:DNA polymerase-3 subunit delta'
LPHALLFEGRAGIGKFLAAKWFAMGCLCAQGPGVPCGLCGPCRRVGSGGERSNHPDLFVIDPILEGEERIRVRRIAERDHEPGESPEPSLEAFLSLRPVEGRYRLVLVRESQRMILHAQNALLKTLEEPRPGTVIVLETHRPAGLLATIKSRCIRIRFQPLAHAACEEVLRTSGLDAQEAGALARLGEGSPGRALDLARSSAPAILARLAEVALGRSAPSAAAAELWELDGEFSGKSESAMERERCRVVLDLAQALVRDAWRASAGVTSAELAHGDTAIALAGRVHAAELHRRGLALAEARADVDHNLAAGALIERGLAVLAFGPA